MEPRAAATIPKASIWETEKDVALAPPYWEPHLLPQMERKALSLPHANVSLVQHGIALILGVSAL